MPEHDTNDGAHMEQVDAYLRMRLARQDAREELLDEIVDHVDVAAQTMLSATSRQAERAFAIATAMALEAIFTVLRQEILEEIRMKATMEPFTIGEVILLQGRSYEIKQNGVVARRGAKIPLESYTKFTLRCLMKAYGMQEGDVEHQEASKLISGVATIRNRLVHPKSSEDLSLDKSDIDCLRECLSWLHRLLEGKAEAALRLWDEVNRKRELHIPGLNEITFFDIDKDMLNPGEI